MTRLVEDRVDRAQTWEEDRARRLEEDLAQETKWTADRARECKEDRVRWEEDRVQREQKDDQWFKIEMKALKAQQARLELFLKSLLTTSIQPSKIL